MSFTFTKEERLKSQKMIGQMFKGGQSYLAYPIRVVWLPYPDDFHHLPNAPIQVMVSAPKRQFKTAVARNRIKRLVREAWRLHKQEMYEKLPENTPQFALPLMYIAKEELPWTEVESGVQKAIRKWPGTPK